MLYLLYVVGIPIAIMCEIAVVNKLAIDKQKRIKEDRMKKLIEFQKKLDENKTWGKNK